MVLQFCWSPPGGLRPDLDIACLLPAFAAAHVEAEFGTYGRWRRHLALLRAKVGDVEEHVFDGVRFADERLHKPEAP